MKLACYIGLLVAPTVPNVIIVSSDLITTALGLVNVLDRFVMPIYLSFSKNQTSYLTIDYLTAPTVKTISAYLHLCLCSAITATSSGLFVRQQSCVSMYLQCLHCTSVFS